MVDSIHKAGRRGVVQPPGQLRKVGHRNPSRKDSREEGDTEPQTTEEESRAHDSDIDPQAVDDFNEIAVSSDNPNNRQTGRRIDVRI